MKRSPSKTRSSQKSPRFPHEPRNQCNRFRQLLDLARDGDDGAKSELWNSYSFDFDRQEAP